MRHEDKDENEVLIAPNIFRAYDVRGIYPDDLNEDAAYKIALSFARLYPKAKKIVVARDTRKSSPALAAKIKEALVESGKEVFDIGIAPDPLFYFSIFHYPSRRRRIYDGGIMVSGSHNPKEYNGLMMHIRKEKGKISEDVIGKDLEKIKKLAMGREELQDKMKRGRIHSLEISKDYMDFVGKKIKLKRPLKIIIDSGNGACGFLPENIFKKLGCKVKTIFGDFDGNFPNHLPDPYDEKNLAFLKKEVLERKADLGFAFDSDGDRVGVIDNKGRVVSGDDCLLILAREVLQRKKGPIVHDVRVSKAFLDEMEKLGAKTYFSISHHSAVIRKIIEKKAVFGGEITLHFLFPLDYYLCDEAIFASLKIAEIASRQKDFAEYLDTLPRYHASPEVFIDSTDEEKFNIIKKLQKYLREKKYNFVSVDGARINFPHGWALARAANTTPIIKCRFEGDTKEDLIKIENTALKIFKKVGIPVTKKTYQSLGLVEI